MGSRKLNEELRSALKVPFGQVCQKIERAQVAGCLLIAVGDTCAYNLLKSNIEPDVVVYDFKNMRKPIDETTRHELEKFCSKRIAVYNPSGHVTDELVLAIRKAIDERRTCVFVEGEEDLAALVAMIYAPDNSIVVYGQPGEGVVIVKINEEVRKRAMKYYESMETF